MDNQNTDNVLTVGNNGTAVTKGGFETVKTGATDADRGKVTVKMLLLMTLIRKSQL